MLPVTQTSLLEHPLHTPRHTSTPSGPGAPGAPLLQTPHLSRDLASSGVRFPLRSLRTLSPARRRARRAPRPPRRSAMARARSPALTAPGPRGPPDPAHLQRYASSGPPPLSKQRPARSPCGRGSGTDPHTAQAPGLGAALCRGRLHPAHPLSPRSSPAPLPRSRGPSSWPWPRYVFRPPEAPRDPLVRVLEDLKLGLHKVGGKTGPGG